MDVQASPDELPELKEFLGSFQVRFRPPEGADALERYMTGLLTELPSWWRSGCTCPRRGRMIQSAGVRRAFRRPCPLEQFHEEAKGELGWDHDQGRLWPGFHRHAVTVRLAYSFLVCLELHQRRRPRGRGRPRHPFSPSAGSAAPQPTSGPS